MSEGKENYQWGRGSKGLKMGYIHCMSTAWGVSYTNFVEENTKSNSYRDHEDQENVFWNNAETGQNTNIHLQLNFCPTTENFFKWPWETFSDTFNISNFPLEFSSKEKRGLG